MEKLCGVTTFRGLVVTDRVQRRQRLPRTGEEATNGQVRTVSTNHDTSSRGPAANNQIRSVAGHALSIGAESSEHIDARRPCAGKEMVVKLHPPDNRNGRPANRQVELAPSGRSQPHPVHVAPRGKILWQGSQASQLTNR